MWASSHVYQVSVADTPAAVSSAAPQEGRQGRQEEGVFLRRWQGQEEEVVQGQAEGEAERGRLLRQELVREAQEGGSQLQAHHPLHHL